MPVAVNTFRVVVVMLFRHSWSNQQYNRPGGIQKDCCAEKESNQ